MLGYPEAALADASHALKHAREVGQAPTLMFALGYSSLTECFGGSYASANALHDELILLADQKGAPFWKATGEIHQGCLSALTGKASDAVQMITGGLTTYRSMGATLLAPIYRSHLASAYAELGQFDDAWCSIGGAMTAVETTKERWFEALISRSLARMRVRTGFRPRTKPPPSRRFAQ